MKAGSSHASPKIALKLLHIKARPIWEQLSLEEALFRTSASNWCIINESSLPALVIGISQNVEEVIHLDEAQRQQIPIIRRFTGGGTVVVDEGTLFCSFLFNKEGTAAEFHPSGILQWAHELLKPAFHPRPFTLQESDFAFHDKKIGGNAQALANGRFINHTSFLWEWNKERLKTLRFPPRVPDWRQGRPHEEFMGQLKCAFSSKECLTQKIIEALSDTFLIEDASLDEASFFLTLPHRKALEIVPPTLHT